MVANPRETLRTGTFKPLNTPEPVNIEEDSTGSPVAVKIKRRVAIIAIENRWRIDDEWWRREPVSRLYYTVLLTSGRRLVFYKDLTSNCWYRQSL